MNYFFIDAETDGLYGKFISVAVLVTDECGRELESFYGAIDVLPEEISSDWVKENVLPHLENAKSVYKTEYDLLEAVWTFWMKYRETSFAVSDVMHPVESRLFTECVRHNLKEREFLSPFPLLDLSTLLISRDIHWDADRQELSGLELISHDAMNDVKLTAVIWHKYIKE